MKQVLKALHQRPIAVYPIYIDLTGSIAGGLLLSQLLYWLEKVDREIWKTDAEIMAETRLTQTEFKNAKKAIAALPFMSVAKKGTPPTTRYNVDWDKMNECLEEMLSSVTYQLNRRLSTNKRGGNLPNKRVGNLPYNTETTSETTPKNTLLEPQNEIPVKIHDEIEGIPVVVHDTIPSTQEQTFTPNSAAHPSLKKAKKQTKYIYPPTLEEVIPLMYAKLTEKKKQHPQIIDCWNNANMQAEKFILHHEGKGWKIERLNSAIALWVNNAIGYGQLTKPCPIQYKNNPDTQQPARPMQPAQQERPILTQHDIEATAQNVAAVSELFKNMGVRV